MAPLAEELTDRLTAFIEAQQMFFVGTAAEDGRVNVSPKGTDSLRVLGPRRIVWLNLTGSGNETAAHLRLTGRITLMFCALEDAPMILRVYGKARAIHPRDAEWETLCALFPPNYAARQMIDVDVEAIQTSCGFGVPLYSYEGERDQLTKWVEKRGPEGIREYWAVKNHESIDGFPTGILADPDRGES